MSFVPWLNQIASATQGIRALQYAQKTIKAGDTIANTTAKTSFQSQYVFPANSLLTGQVYEMDGYGIFNSALALPGAVTCGLQCVNQSTAAVTPLVSAQPMTLGANLSGMPYHFRAKLLVQASGASGIVRCGGILFYHSSGIALAATPYVMTPTSVSIDTTAPQAIQIWTQFTLASASVSSQLMLLDVESKQPVPASN